MSRHIYNELTEIEALPLAICYKKANIVVTFIFMILKQSIIVIKIFKDTFEYKKMLY